MNISQAIIESKDNKRYKELLKLKKGNKEEITELSPVQRIT